MLLPIKIEESRESNALMTRKLEIGLALILVGTSFAFGGVQPIAYSLAEIFVYFIFILLLWDQTRHGKVSMRLPIWPLLFVLWVALQLLPLPHSFLGAVSPAHRLIQPWLASIQQTSSWRALSISPAATLLGLFKVLAYIGVFILAVQLFDSGRRKSAILGALIALGCFEAGYGILQYLLGWNKIFGVTNPYDSWVAFGTYINRNHFAGLMDLTFPFAFASAYYSYEIWSNSQCRAGSTRSSGESPVGFRIVFYLFLAVIMVVGVVFSNSRGGILSVSFALISLSVLTLFKARRRTWGLVISGLIVLAVAFSLWIGTESILHRFVNMSQAEYADTLRRSMMWSDTLQLVHHNPILGTGLGTYEDAFRPFQTHLVNLTVDHTHNDYLEFASETGLIGFGLLFIPIFYLLARMVISFLRDHRRYRSAVLLGCTGSTVALLIHSITDFNLQVPANAMIFAAILGIGYKAACLEPRQEIQGSETSGL
ncbi:MAG: O-antigen ligase domain-containing protein [Acidobacteria bacterium]|nr:MAG: O-antigen ligase domain-containing protein [Acidobacteriota bacterium]